ncbi:hypothetical protein COHA_000384 [Chlorella ohadii]|uniref:Peptidase S1 domain-containing protein n=1 Tax=Chlorella ohadii TaxID=2649997 RepID=A0AAD5H941_9CHLO|nr:hypothetical protein COHA_000384 [Chlorella ohadii]
MSLYLSPTSTTSLGLYVSQVNDIALLLLDRPSTMRPLLRLPPAVPRPAAAPGTLLTAIGWGLTDMNQFTFPSVLQEATLEMLPQKQCAAYFADLIPKAAWDSQFCAGEAQGEDGSPLIWKGPSGDVAIGVTTLSFACGSDYPAVYADVAAASNWIRNAIQWMLREDAAGRIRGPATNGSRSEGA